MYTRRKYNRAVKSLLHFDFPYYAEPNDGLRDEVSSETWTRSGSVKFVGTEIPNDAIAAECPKFGYRCPQFSGSEGTITGTNNSGIWNFESDKNYEVEFFVRITDASRPGAVFSLSRSDGTSALSLTFIAERQFFLTFGTNSVRTASTFELNSWTHILLRISLSKITLYCNGAEYASMDLSPQKLAVNRVHLGGFTGQLDEFVMRHSAVMSVNVPSEPYKGILEVKEAGGFGDSKHGNLTLASNSQINTYGMLTSASAGTYLYVTGYSTGRFGAPAAGDEIMILVTAPRGTEYADLGSYAFRKVISANGNAVRIDSAVTEEFNLDAAVSKYYVQIITVPNFSTLKVNSGADVLPAAYTANYGGGIIIFRASNSVVINGRLLCSGYGPVRTDLRQVCNANLIDAFIMNKGGGVFIAAKNFNASSSARIGASWSGDAKGGTGVYAGAGTPGGAGYGGGGGGDYDQHGTGGSGGVGGGGGGYDYYGAARAGGGNAGASGRTGGAGIGQPGGSGGTQGVTAGGNSQPAGGEINSAGGGAGGNSNDCGGVRGGYSGSNVIIIAENFSADASTISTGGECGYSGKNATGGGGSGFCCLAVKEMK